MLETLNRPRLYPPVLKAKYFLRRNFLDANFDHNPSYTWRSIWSVLWICNLHSLKPSTPPSLHQEDLMVNSLLNTSLNSWNITLVRSLFNDVDVAAVLSTPLFAHSSSNVCSGKLRWMVHILLNRPTIFVHIWCLLLT